MGKLTDRQIQAFTYPKDKGRHADGDSLFLDVRSGSLFLEVFPTGGKYWRIGFRFPKGARAKGKDEEAPHIPDPQQYLRNQHNQAGCPRILSAVRVNFRIGQVNTFFGLLAGLCCFWGHMYSFSVLRAGLYAKSCSSFAASPAVAFFQIAVGCVQFFGLFLCRTAGRLAQMRHLVRMVLHNQAAIAFLDG